MLPEDAENHQPAREQGAEGEKLAAPGLEEVE
jgi:hypothetical protein